MLFTQHNIASTSAHIVMYNSIKKNRSYGSNRHIVPLDECRPLQNVSMDRCFNTNRTMQVEADKEMQTHKHRSTNRWSLLAGWPPMEAKQGEALSEARPR